MTGLALWAGTHPVPCAFYPHQILTEEMNDGTLSAAVAARRADSNSAIDLRLRRLESLTIRRMGKAKRAHHFYSPRQWWARRERAFVLLSHIAAEYSGRESDS
jgi:hypothetical protein